MKKHIITIFTVLSFSIFFSCTFNDKEKIAFHEKGKIQIDPELKELGELNALLLHYDNVDEKAGDYIVVESNHKKGVINLYGDTIIAFNYDEIDKIPDTDYWKIKVVNEEMSHLSPSYMNYYKEGIADAYGSILLFPVYWKCRPVGNGLFEVEGNGHYLVNEQGKKIKIENEYDDLTYFDAIALIDGNTYIISDFDDNWYRMTYNKNTEPQCQLDTISYFGAMTAQNVCFVNHNGKWGAIDKNGKQIVPFIYCNVKTNGTRAFLQNDEGKWGMFTGKDVCSFYYNYPQYADKYFFAIDDSIHEQANIIVVDNQGKELFRKRLGDMSFEFSHGAFLGRHQVFDEKGKAIIKISDTLQVVNFMDNYVVVRTSKNLFGILDKKGKEVVPLVYKDFFTYSESTNTILMPRCVKDEIIDGVRVIEIQDDIFNTGTGKLTKTMYIIYSFHDGLALAEDNKSCRRFLVNTSGDTGIRNMEEVLKTIAEQKANKERNEKEEKIKVQLCDMMNERHGWQVVTVEKLKEFKSIDPDTIDGVVYNYQAQFNVDNGTMIQYCSVKISADSKGNVFGFNNKIIDVHHYGGNGRQLIHIPSAEEQMEYYQQKLMEGNRYNPYK